METVVTDTLDQLIEKLRVDPKRGLSNEEAAERLDRNGPNKLVEKPAVAWWWRFLSQFFSVMIGLLLVAAVLSGLLGDWFDTVAIVAILILNATLGFVQESRAEKAIESLHVLSAPQAKVRREGNLSLIPAVEVVVGDVIYLEAGDRVPADARLLQGFDLHVVEASLTGESTAVSKSPDREIAANAAIGDQVNRVFLGTTVTSGKATAIVTATGMQTEIGRIATLLQNTENEPTPLQRRLHQLGQMLVVVCLVLVSIIFVVQMIRGGEEKLADAFLTSVSLAVAAIPEGLPAVVTVTLAIGLQRMAKRNALIRKLPSVETLGCVTVICSDKTGTLTCNAMTVRRLWVSDRWWQVDGEGYQPFGKIVPDEVDSQLDRATNPTMLRMLSFADSCNNASWSYDLESKLLQTVGDPTEIALKVVAAKAGVANELGAEDLIHENSFDSDRKRMSQIYRDASGELVMIVKGAAESILMQSNRVVHDRSIVAMDDSLRSLILQRTDQLAGDALRVLAIAYRDVSNDDADWHDESGLVFLGLIGMIDPPRPEARDAVRRCREAGIRPVMITGDHPQTAFAIAKQLGIANGEEQVVMGQAIELASDVELIEMVKQYSVMARVSAEHKLRVVNACKRSGHVVAMTGDGVNDAPAVKAADIGVVMGITGTDVTKEAADMVLTDDNFVSIVNAVEEGRGVYENIQKFLHYLLACNTSEVLFMFLSSVIGWPSPLVAVQLLWINLVTDGLPALALASEPLSRDLMQKPPRPVREPILPWRRWRDIAAHGSLMAAITLIGFGITFRGDMSRLAEARAVAFTILTMSQIFYAMACRDLNRIMPSVGVLSNPMLFWAALGSVCLQLVVTAIPWTAHVLGLEAMPWSDMPMILLLSLLPVTIVELKKIFYPPKIDLTRETR